VEHYLNQIRGQTLVVEVDNYNESPWTRVIMNVPVPEGIMFDRSLSDEDTPYAEYGRRMDGSEIRATRVHPHTPVAPPAAPAERTARGPYGYQHGWD
jgi:hypothetical protein